MDAFYYERLAKWWEAKAYVPNNPSAYWCAKLAADFYEIALQMRGLKPFNGHIRESEA